VAYLISQNLGHLLAGGVILFLANDCFIMLNHCSNRYLSNKVSLNYSNHWLLVLAYLNCSFLLKSWLQMSKSYGLVIGLVLSGMIYLGDTALIGSGL